jgi:desulfoferrodoxin (superoxide reductase-like protein)
MKYLCVNCNYVYDKSMWDSEENIEIWTELEKCPVCEEYDSFQWIEEEINYIDDDSLGALEIDHFPEVTIKNDKLIVSVGNEIHPMWEWHRIASISLYDEYWDLIEEKYLELETEANAEFNFDDLDEFEIRVKCSIHWIWWKKFFN